MQPIWSVAQTARPMLTPDCKMFTNHHPANGMEPTHLHFVTSEKQILLCQPDLTLFLVTPEVTIYLNRSEFLINIYWYCHIFTPEADNSGRIFLVTVLNHSWIWIPRLTLWCTDPPSKNQTLYTVKWNIRRESTYKRDSCLKLSLCLAPRHEGSCERGNRSLHIFNLNVRLEVRFRFELHLFPKKWPAVSNGVREFVNGGTRRYPSTHTYVPLFGPELVPQ